MIEQKKNNIVVSIPFLTINAYWLLGNVQSLYNNYTGGGILYFVSLPDWYFVSNIIISIIGNYFAIKLILNKLKLRRMFQIEFYLLLIVIALFLIMSWLL